MRGDIAGQPGKQQHGDFDPLTGIRVDAGEGSHRPGHRPLPLRELSRDRRPPADLRGQRVQARGQRQRTAGAVLHRLVQAPCTSPVPMIMTRAAMIRMVFFMMRFR